MIKLFFAILVMNSVYSFSQIKKEVENGVYVTFPILPEFKTNTQTTSYIATTENCLFLTMILRNQIPNYSQYLQAKEKWSKEEIKTVEDSFLDNAIKGKLDYTGNKGIVTEINIGEFRGRKLEYSAINPASGERGKRFTIILFVRDKFINFECWYLKDNHIAETEKENYLNSITTD